MYLLLMGHMAMVLVKSILILKSMFKVMDLSMHWCLIQSKALGALLAEGNYVQVVRLLCERRELDVAALLLEVCLRLGIVKTDKNNG